MTSGNGTALGSVAAGTGLALAGTYPTQTLNASVANSTANTWTGSNFFAEAHGTAYAPALTTNNYTLQASDCGKLLLMPVGAASATVTLFNYLGAAGQGCTIAVEQASGTNQYTVTAAGGATFNSVNTYTKTKGQYAIIILTVDAPSATAAHWVLSGDGA
jgi:hypothetical protein